MTLFLFRPEFTSETVPELRAVKLFANILLELVYCTTQTSTQGILKQRGTVDFQMKTYGTNMFIKKLPGKIQAVCPTKFKFYCLINLIR
jgi:hypothetical protein